MTISLQQLPYPAHALEPHLSRETIGFHHDKHHRAYVENTNKLLAEHPPKQESLEHLILRSTGELFNNAAQVWNHNFYWHCLCPPGEQRPGPGVERALKASFGSVEAFREQFTDAATSHFGSGWAWLVRGADGALEVLATANADNPMVSGRRPILVCDVWEHAYYIDYRNARPDYLKHFWPLVNWSFVAANLTAAARSDATPSLAHA